jgi:hypothetical protein
MTPAEVHQLNLLLKKRQKQGANALWPSEKEELIGLLLKQIKSSGEGEVITVAPRDDVDEYGQHGGSARA